MLGEEKNLKDFQKESNLALKDTNFTVSYTKTNKLVTALYMVTDMMENTEPLRTKLRTLGAGVISDMHSVPSKACSKISEIMSFLEISSTINLISEMNSSILRKEFTILNSSIIEAFGERLNLRKKIDIAEFLKEDTKTLTQELHKGHVNSNGHQYPFVRVRKNSDVYNLSDRNIKENRESFDILKKERREEISKIVISIPSGATIKDIKEKSSGPLKSCGEKTLQRELVSMVRDGILQRTGEKRWSRYFLATLQT